MILLKSFEMEALKALAGDTLPHAVIEKLTTEGKRVSLEFSGVGYFLTLRHPDLPVEKIALTKPLITGKAGDLRTGFVAFVENREITLECFSFGSQNVPKTYRDLDVTLTLSED